MLELFRNKPVAVLTLLCLVILQIILISNQQLFGDEAFYWLEGQFPAWSYTELPGWTAWMTGLATHILGNNYFSVRILPFTAFLSCLIAVRFIMTRYNRNQFLTDSVLLVFSVPLLALIATMALPDIWMITVTVWVCYFFIRAIEDNKVLHWLILGILLAIAINIHVRLWIWMFFAGLSFLMIFIKDLLKYSKLFSITLPIALIGFIPVIWFNIHHDYALFTFQFSNRHPWNFQFDNIYFILSQFLVVSPLVFILWLSQFRSLIQSKQNKAILWILLTSILHWLFYAVTTLFADGLRTNIHWLLISYIPVLIITPLISNTTLLRKTAIISGTLLSFALLITMVFFNSAGTNRQSRILDNSSGWKQLAVAVRELQQRHRTEYIVADYFMTAAELAFELDIQSIQKHIKVLPHEKNIKHGRQKQLDIMSLLLKSTESYSQHALLVVEDSSVKLEDKGSYYSGLCEKFPSLQYIRTVNISNSSKQFQIFEINNGSNGCSTSPVFYIQHEFSDTQIHISGWVISNKIKTTRLSLIASSPSLEIPVIQRGIEIEGIQNMFPQIKDPDSPNNGFAITIDKDQLPDGQLQIKAYSDNGKSYLSPIYFLY